MDYKNKIIEMIQQVNNETTLYLIYKIISCLMD